MPDLLFPTFLAALAGLASVLGGLLAVRTATPRYSSETFAAVAGFLLAAAFLDLLPEAAEANPQVLPYVFVGYLLVYAAENLAPSHLHSAHGGHHAPMKHGKSHTLSAIPPQAGAAAGIGLILHAFFDGVALSSALRAGLSTALLLFFAIAIHQIPVGFGLATVMRAGGYRKRTVLAATGSLLVATTIGGVTAALVTFEVPSLEAIMLAIAAGTFIYIGATDMIPATHSGGCRRCVWFSLLGILVFVATATILESIGLA